MTLEKITTVWKDFAHDMVAPSSQQHLPNGQVFTTGWRQYIMEVVKGNNMWGLLGERSYHEMSICLGTAGGGWS